MKYYVVDSFTDHVFGGGPAAVMILPRWLPDETMQNIAMENNLADTAFAVKAGDDYDLRWFMPEAEINLNGHATLAAAYIIFRFYEPERGSVRFRTKSGDLIVTRDGDWLELELPAVRVAPYPFSDAMRRALGVVPKETYFGQNLLFVLEDEAAVAVLRPDFEQMKALPEGQGCFVTARAPEGADYDIVGRTFWPKMGVNEDPVCGNMHCNLAPFWAERLGRDTLVSHQLSKRGAVVKCTACGDRVKLKGQAALFAAADIFVE